MPICYERKFIAMKGINVGESEEDAITRSLDRVFGWRFYFPGYVRGDWFSVRASSNKKSLDFFETLF